MKPSCTMRMHSGGYCRASDMASVGVPLSQVENSSSVVSSTGMRSWLIVSTREFGVVVRKLDRPLVPAPDTGEGNRGRGSVYYPIQHKPKMRPAIHMMTNEALIGLLAFAKKAERQALRSGLMGNRP